MARYKVQVIPKPKLCEALKASDYACDVLLDETQANQLGRFLSVNAYTTGTLERSGGTIATTVRVRDIGSSDRKSTRLNSSHGYISYAVFCLKKKKKTMKKKGIH